MREITGGSDTVLHLIAEYRNPWIGHPSLVSYWLLSHDLQWIENETSIFQLVPEDTANKNYNNIEIYAGI